MSVHTLHFYYSHRSQKRPWEHYVKHNIATTGCEDILYKVELSINSLQRRRTWHIHRCVEWWIANHLSKQQGWTTLPMIYGPVMIFPRSSWRLCLVNRGIWVERLLFCVIYSTVLFRLCAPNQFYYDPYCIRISFDSVTDFHFALLTGRVSFSLITHRRLTPWRLLTVPPWFIWFA